MSTLRRLWGSPAGRHVAAALPGWVTARLVVGMTLVAAHVVVALFPVLTQDYHVDQGLLGWDADWYVRIASEGYAALPRLYLRFFPLLPGMARALLPIVGDRPGLAVLLVANTSALVLGALVHRVCIEEHDDGALARRAAWLVALVPPAFVLVWGYAEALSGVLAVATFLALRRQRWGWAAVFGLLGGLARPLGLLVAVPALIEAMRGLRGAGSRGIAGRVAAVAAPAVGAALYLAWVGARYGDPLLPFTVQSRDDLRGGFANPFAVLGRGARQLLEGDLVDGRLLSNGVHVPWFVVFVVLIVVAFRRWPASYGAFALVTLVVACTAERLGSFERYGFGAFPVVLALATVTARPNVERLVIGLSTAAMAAYGTLALLGAYVP